MSHGKEEEEEIKKNNDHKLLHNSHVYFFVVLCVFVYISFLMFPCYLLLLFLEYFALNYRISSGKIHKVLIIKLTK